jgi:hypothetical protein
MAKSILLDCAESIPSTVTAATTAITPETAKARMGKSTDAGARLVKAGRVSSSLRRTDASGRPFRQRRRAAHGDETAGGDRVETAAHPPTRKAARH